MGLTNVNDAFRRQLVLSSPSKSMRSFEGGHLRLPSDSRISSAAKAEVVVRNPRKSVTLPVVSPTANGWLESSNGAEDSTDRKSSTAPELGLSQAFQRGNSPGKIERRHSEENVRLETVRRPRRGEIREEHSIMLSCLEGPPTMMKIADSGFSSTDNGEYKRAVDFVEMLFLQFYVHTVIAVIYTTTRKL